MDAPVPMAETIDALLAVTPEPPSLDADPALVAIAAERMLREREPLCRTLAELRAVTPAVPASHAQQYATLIDRNQRWTACLSHACHTLGERMDGFHRSRHAYPQP